MQWKKRDWKRGWPVQVPPMCNLERVRERLLSHLRAERESTRRAWDPRGHAELIGALEAFVTRTDLHTAKALLKIDPNLASQFDICSPSGFLYMLGGSYGTYLFRVLLPQAERVAEKANADNSNDPVILWRLQLETAIYLVYKADRQVHELSERYRDDFVDGMQSCVSDNFVTSGIPLIYEDDYTLNELCEARQAQYALADFRMSENTRREVPATLLLSTVTNNIHACMDNPDLVTNHVVELEFQSRTWIANRIAESMHSFGVKL